MIDFDITKWKFPIRQWTKNYFKLVIVSVRSFDNREDHLISDSLVTVEVTKLTPYLIKNILKFQFHFWWVSRRFSSKLRVRLLSMTTSSLVSFEKEKHMLFSRWTVSSADESAGAENILILTKTALASDQRRSRACRQRWEKKMCDTRFCASARVTIVKAKKAKKNTNCDNCSTMPAIAR